MEQLNSILEKVLTLNVNANTNVDIQSIIETWIILVTLGKVLIVFAICFTVTLIVLKVVKSIWILNAGETIKKTIKDYDHWDRLIEVSEKLDKIINGQFNINNDKD